MKHSSITRDPDTQRIPVEVMDRGTRYWLRHIPFHRAAGFSLDSSQPGSLDRAIAIVADWLGEYPITDSLKTQFWECLALSGDVHTRFVALVEGDTCLILGNDIDVCIAGRSRYIMEREPSMSAMTCDGC